MLKHHDSSAILAVSDLARARAFYGTVLGLAEAVGEVSVLSNGPSLEKPKAGVTRSTPAPPRRPILLRGQPFAGLRARIGQLCCGHLMGGISMRVSFFGRAAAVALTLASAQPAAAQTTSEATPACELHFWPTDDALANSNIFINAALQSGVTTGNVLLDHLPARAQIAALERLDLPRLLNMPSVRVVLASEPVRDSVAARQRTRLSSSTTPCYAELVVKRMGYRTDPIQGRDFGAVFIFRRFDAGGTEARIVQGAGDVGLRIFPPRHDNQREAAREEIAAAFGTVFEEFVSKKLNRGGR